MSAGRLRWILWAWRVAGASYVAGALPLTPGGLLIVFWTALLFTPLLVVTLVVTRSRTIAIVGIPLIGSALLVACYLFFVLSTQRTIPEAPAFQVLALVAILGPLALYFVVSRHVRGLIRAVVNPVGS